MVSPTLAVAVLGDSPLADRIADRIDARAGLTVHARIHPGSPVPPPGTDCVAYIPSFAEIAADAPRTVVPGLLREGYDVISTAPVDGYAPDAAIAAACRAGGSAFHATGAFQAAIPGRLIRSLAEVTRGIRRVELVEELDLTASGVYPWETPAELGLGTADTGLPARSAALVDGYYAAGLRVLDETVFGGTATTTATPDRSVEVITDLTGSVQKVVVDRDLGPGLSYRSVWSAATANRAPLRYKLTTTTDSAKGTANVRFKCTEGLHPADHLTCVTVVEAIRPVHERRADRPAGIAGAPVRCPTSA
ncbi:hypothetical protein [Nocardia carnea]|uniref:hypothetical protein n=1 Tax=Nocardia carnea TaxID=37328 RepID=UPI0024541159|nr:hypothetical protein [Nocardia carnea]